ncbi:MAG TPA: UDP-3-O-(3-hydroxymyristoyl)glucosamine N-acyltransferase [Candidatus Eisenbacteria bacterium]|nr:UDP-3-O-(3-hydroxymyristoyl)glucosamine N-acyltransferase [Candidatus Eisenbacteria bacterium]
MSAGAAKTLAELAEHVGGKVRGDAGIEIHKVAPIEDAEPGAITFLTHPRYAKFLKDCKASAVVASPDARLDPTGRIAVLETAEPYVAVAKILRLFNPPRRYGAGVSPLAVIEASATLAAEVAVFPYVYIGREARIGERTVLFPGVFIGDGSAVGDDCVLHPNVTVREGCRIGDRVILHPGVVIGSDGFGYAGQGAERVKIPQVGTVVIESDVEIGANSTVDRATLGRTVIGRGTKIDNLVQIAHNVSIGENTVVAAQVGIAGSTRIGRNVTLAGQVGIVNHVTIGDGAVIGPQSGIPRSVPAGALLSGGIAAAPHHEWLKVMTLLPQLPKLWHAVRQLEKRVSKLVSGR